MCFVAIRCTAHSNVHIANARKGPSLLSQSLKSVEKMKGSAAVLGAEIEVRDNKLRTTDLIRPVY